MSYPDINNLTTVKTLKDWAKIKDAGTAVPVTGGDSIDIQLQNLITFCSNVIVKVVNQTPLFAADVIRYLNGNDKQVLFFREPLNSVSSLKINGFSIPVIDPSNYLSTGFYFDSEGIYLRGCTWFYDGVQNIEVHCNVGYATNSVEQGLLETACLEYCNYQWSHKDHPDKLGSKAQGFFTDQYVQEALPKSVELIIHKLLANRIPYAS